MMEKYLQTSPINTSKTTYCRICMNTNICVCFRSIMMMTKKMMTNNTEDNGEIFADVSD